MNTECAYKAIPYLVSLAVLQSPISRVGLYTELELGSLVQYTVPP